MAEYASLNRGVYEGRVADVERLVHEALAEARDPQEIVREGLIAGMSVVGEDFKRNVLYVPEVLMAARAMKAGMAILGPRLSARNTDAASAGVVVIGTVRGDYHDIGKNLVCLLAEGAGFTVYDLGVDQPADKFLAAAQKHGASVVAVSALLTTTMAYMKTVVDRFRTAGLERLPIAVGGAPVTQVFADEIGAHGYAENAAAAVDLFKRLVAGAAR